MERFNKYSDGVGAQSKAEKKYLRGARSIPDPRPLNAHSGSPMRLSCAGSGSLESATETTR